MTRVGHHHGSHTPTSPWTILLGKMAYHTKQIRREHISLFASRYIDRPVLVLENRTGCLQMTFSCSNYLVVNFLLIFFLIFTKKQEPLVQLQKEKKNIVEAMPSRSEASSALMGFN